MTWIVAAVWTVFYAIALATSDQPPAMESALLQLAGPPLLWVLAIRFVLRHWWSESMDPPQRLLAVAVALLPERRREWGRAMTAELAEVRGRSARWRFALSTVRATLCLPPAGRWQALVLVTGAGVAATTAAGPVAAAAVPGLRTFAATFTGLLAAMAVTAVARSRRLERPVPAPAALVTGAVAAAIAVTALFLRREPSAAGHLPPAAAVSLAAVLAVCLWIALAAPRWLGTDRLAPHLGAVAGLAFTAWFLLAIRTDGVDLPLPLVLVLALVLPLAPIAAFFVPAFAAGRADRSFRTGLKAAVWTVATTVPLSYALWLPEGLRRHAVDGTLLSGELAPVGGNLSDALIFCLGIFPVLGLPLAVIGAALGARRTRRAVVGDPS